MATKCGSKIQVLGERLVSPKNVIDICEKTVVCGSKIQVLAEKVVIPKKIFGISTTVNKTITKH